MCEIFENKGDGVVLDDGGHALILSHKCEIKYNLGWALKSNGGGYVPQHRTVGANPLPGGIFNVSKCTLKDVKVSKNKKGGISVSDGGVVHMERGSVVDNRGRGVDISGRKGYDEAIYSSTATLTGTKIRQNQKGGCRSQDGAMLVLDEVSIEKNKGMGVSLKSDYKETLASCSLTNSTIFDNSAGGVKVFGGELQLHLECKIKGNKGDGVLLDGGCSSLLSDGQSVVAGNSGIGVHLKRGSNATLSHNSNVVGNLGEANVSVSGEGSSFEAQNVDIEYGSGNGIQVTDAAKAKLSHVNLIKPELWGIDMRGEGTTVECNNVFVTECGKTGMVVRQGALLVYHTGKVTKNKKGGIVIKDEGTTAELHEITCSQNQNDGVRVQSSAKASIVKSDFNSQSKAGVVVGGHGSELQIKSTRLCGNGRFGVKVEDHGLLAAQTCNMRDNKFGSYSVAGSSTVSIDGSNDVDDEYTNPGGMVRASLDKYLC